MTLKDKQAWLLTSSIEKVFNFIGTLWQENFKPTAFTKIFTFSNINLFVSLIFFSEQFLRFTDNYVFPIVVLKFRKFF